MSCLCYSREGIKKRRFQALEWLATVASYASIKREGVMESNVYVPQAARLNQVPARSFTSTIPKSGIVSIMEVHGSNLCSPPDLRLRIEILILGRLLLIRLPCQYLKMAGFKYYGLTTDYLILIKFVRQPEYAVLLPLPVR